MGEAEVPASMRRRLSGCRPVLLILGLATALAVLAAALLAPLADHRPVLSSPQMPWWLLVAAFAAAQFCTVRIQTGRGEHTVSAAACPLVIGLFFASPPHLLLSGLLGTLIVQLVHRRRHVDRLVFNLSMFAAESMVASTLFGMVSGAGSPAAPRIWLVTVGAVLAADVLSSVVIGAAIAVVDGGVSPRSLARTTAEGALPLPLIVCLSLMAVTCLALAPQSSWPLLVTGVGFLLAFRGYAGLTNRRLQAQRLRRLSEAFGLATDFGEGLGAVLAEARQALASERAEVIVVAADGALTRLTLDPDGTVRNADAGDGAGQLLFNLVVGTDTPVLLPRGSRDAADRRYLAALDAREAVAAPLRAGSTGVLVVADRVSDTRTYDEQDAVLLETVAHHVSAALRGRNMIESLRHEALHDALTGLPNRSLFQRRLAAALEQLGDGRSDGVAILLLDLDGFKQVNDTLGHQCGDVLWTEIGSRLHTAAEQVCPAATVARLGGDEFAVLAPDLTEEAVIDLGRRLGAAIDSPVQIGADTARVRGSIGVALAPTHAAEATALLKQADLAMYAAKVSGDGLRLYQPRLAGHTHPQGARP